jgi:Carboxypeptidase regulatory-like domain
MEKAKMKNTKLVIFRQSLAAILLALVACIAIPAPAQVGQATLTGTVEDESGAVVSGAAITLTNTQNETHNTATSDSRGFFSFSSLPAATYEVKIDKSGFAQLQRTIVVHIADHIEIPDIRLAVKAAPTSVNVTGAPVSVTPDTSGEVSYTLTAKQVQNLDIEGRSAIELLGLVPGAADSGNFNSDSYSGQTAGFTQNASAFSVNGNRFDLTQILSDGAVVTDVNTAGAAAITPNVEMIQEVKVVTAAFSSENPSGPIVLQTETKSGGKNFHGEIYGTVRNNALDDTDWRVKHLGLSKPDDGYYYMGANLGGPVIIPGTNFNKNRDKLFFFAAFEKALQYVQDPLLDIREAVTPTDGSTIDGVVTPNMRAGDFSDTAYLQSLNSGAYYATLTPCANPGNNTSLCTTPTSGMINPSAIDPNGQVLINALPLPNRNPATTGGYNLVSSVVTFQPRDQEDLKLDYDIDNRNRLSARYNHEHESVPFPFGYYDNFTPNEYPGGQINRNSSHSIVGNLATSFSSTLLNDLTFAYTRLGFRTYLNDPAAVSRSALGYTAADLYTDNSPIIPNVQPGYGNGPYASLYLRGGSYPTTNGPQQIYVINENLTRILGTHLFKAGVYFAHQQFSQLTAGVENSTIITGDYSYSYNTGNPFADLLTGQIAGYAQSTSNFVANMSEKRTDFFVQDQWRIKPRLTVNYGIRVNHIGSWYEDGGRMVVFDPALYNPGGTYADAPGLVTHATTPSISISGSRPQGFQFAPSGGFAWDFRGTGQTILRGGFSTNYYIDPGVNAFSAVQSPPNETFTSFYGLTTISNIPGINTYLPLGSYGIADINDHHLPVTYSYSFAVNQAFAHAIHVEMAYAGNISRNLTGYANGNVVPEGCPYEYDSYEGYGTGSYNDTLCRPYPLIGGLSTVTHNLSSFYNSAQVTASKQAGRVNFWVTYTFAKALAYNCENPFDERRCYGPPPFDRSQNLNISYLINLPNISEKFLGNNKVLNGILDGWQFTGIEQFASGTPLDFTAAANANGGGGNEYDGINNRTINFYNVYPGTADFSNRNIVGTPDENAVPTVVCNPTSGLQSGQYFNAACFQAPQEGTVGTGPSIGTYRLPYIHGPRYERDDIGLYKSFKINETKSIQFRAQAFDFTNHALNTFIQYDADLYLHFPGYGTLANNASTAGYTENKLGHRTIQLAMKFYF